MANRYKREKNSLKEKISVIDSFGDLSLFERYKHIIILSIIIILFLLFSAYTYKLYVVPATHTKEVALNYDYRQDKTLDKLSQGDKIEQTFIANDNELSGFSLNFATFKTVTNGIIDVSLKDTITGDLLLSQQLDISEIKDNTYRGFYLDDSIRDALNREFSIIVSVSQADEASQISLWKIENEPNLTGKLFINGAEKPRESLCFRVMAGENEFLKPMYWVSIAMISISIVVIYYLALIKKIKIEHVFLITALFCGLFYMFLFTPFSVPDEGIHIGSSYKYSNALMGYEFEHNGVDYVREGDFAKVPLYRTPNADTYRYVSENLFKLSDSNKMIEHKLPYAGNVCQYLFSTLGVTVARMFNLGYLPMLMLGRLFNFAFFITLLYFSIKRIPFGKATLAIIALMPITMSLAISFSYDSVINALAIFFISTVLYIAYSKQKIKWWDILFLCLSAGLLVASKAGIYIFICLMVFIIPIKRFNNKMNYFSAISLVLISCAVFMIVFNLMNIINVSTTPNTVESMDIYTAPKETYSISSIFTSPGNFVKIFVDTINSKSEFYIFSLLGYRLGWININIPIYISLIIGCLLLLSSFRLESEEQFIKNRTKFLFFIICAAVFCMFVIVAYTWTPQGDAIIEGVQGRYFIPILPVFLLIFRNNNLMFKKDIGNKLVFVMCIINVMTMLISYQQLISGNLINVI